MSIGEKLAGNPATVYVITGFILVVIVVNAARQAADKVAEIGTDIYEAAVDAGVITDVTKCEADLAAGDTWESSFSCDGWTWAKSLFGYTPASSTAESNPPKTRALE